MPSGVLERGIIIKMRFGLDHAVNLRPSRFFPGTSSPLANPGDIDFVVVREGTEGSYTGQGGSLRQGTPHEVSNEVSVNTWFGVERTVRYAFELAQKRSKKLTWVHKNNVMVHAGHLWGRVIDAVAPEFPDVAVNYEHADASTMYMVNDPGRYDVIVTDNLFGDIITDEAAAVTGGIGLAPSANINSSREFPSMFEPVHGSAPDIAGRGIADPVAAISSMALLLDHLERPQDAERIRTAVSEFMANRGDESLSTSQIGDKVAKLV